MELLDHFSHADVRTLFAISRSHGDEDTASRLELRPIRGQVRPAMQLLNSAQTAVGAAAAVCETFGVTLSITPWISNELSHYRDEPLPDHL